MPEYEYTCEKCSVDFEKESKDKLVMKVKKHAKKKHDVEKPEPKIREEIEEK